MKFNETDLKNVLNMREVNKLRVTFPGNENFTCIAQRV